MDATDNERAVVRFLEEHDADCPACHHQLRGIPVAVCPECGIGLELGVRAPSIRHSGWVCGLIACSMGLGFDVVVVLIMLWDVIVKLAVGRIAQLPSDVWMIMATLVPLALVCAGMLLVLWKRRHAVLCLPPKWQVVFGVGAFVVVGGVHAGVGGWLMAVLII